MKKAFTFLLKFCISATLAVVILSLWCLVYYNPAVTIPQPDNYTNNRYQPNSWWVNMTEGYGWGRIDNIGYSNRADYDPSLKTITFIGSSQIQAIQVPQDKNMVSLTQELLQGDQDPNNDFQCLNLGVSGHFFNITASNYEYFVEHFDNVDYVIMEISSLDYSAAELDEILAGDYHSSVGERSVLYRTMQKIPYLRLLAKQWQDVSKNNTSTKLTDTPLSNENRYEKLDAIIQKLANLSNEHGIKLIILYHQPFSVNPDETISFDKDTEMEGYLFKSCEANNIPIINMNQPMIDQYQKCHEFSYGFSNTYFGWGHLNETGHALIAQNIYNEIAQQMENQ